MKTIWEELAEFTEETKEAAEACQVSSDEMLDLFIALKNMNLNILR